MGASDDEEDYITYGQPLGEEQHSVAGQYRKDVKDPALTKALPVWQQVRSCGPLTTQQWPARLAPLTARPKQLALQLTADQTFPFTGGHRHGGPEALSRSLHWRLLCRVLQHCGFKGGLGACHIQVIQGAASWLKVLIRVAFLARGLSSCLTTQKSHSS